MIRDDIGRLETMISLAKYDLRDLPIFLVDWRAVVDLSTAIAKAAEDAQAIAEAGADLEPRQ
jgi:hypothetical protein